MTERDISDMYEGLLEGIEMLKGRIDAIESSVQANKELTANLEDVMYNQIILPAQEALEVAKRENGIEEFRGSFGEQLEPFNDTLKAIEGDDFDLVATAYDEYTGLEEPKPEQGEFVEALVATVEEQVGAIKEKLGLVGDVTVEVTEEGEVTIEDEAGTVVDETGEEVSGEVENTEVETEEEGEIVITDEPGAISDPEDIEAFERELRESMGK